jgi:hypothetical protein
MTTTNTGHAPWREVRRSRDGIADDPRHEALARHLWAHRDDLFTFLRQRGLDATNWRAELTIRLGVI